jgi:hypothetical protein
MGKAPQYLKAIHFSAEPQRSGKTSLRCAGASVLQLAGPGVWATLWSSKGFPAKSMNIQVAVLCDAATDDNGKLNLLGAFDTIYTPQLPAIHPQCSVALRITFFNGEEGKRELRFNFVDADGKSIMPDFPPIPIDVTLPEDMHFGTRNFIVNIQQLKFDSPGLYSIDISFDGRSQASVPLMVKHNPPTGP